MNLSILSTYDNISACEKNLWKSTVYQTINELLNINGDVDAIVFCPLCVATFEYKFSLFEHLKTCHHNFILRANDKNIGFIGCPFCSAKFYGKHLTVRHSILYHSKIIQELFVDTNSRCNFCEEKLNKKDCCKTIKHIEEKHFIDFEEDFSKRFLLDILEMTFSEFINSTVGADKTINCAVKWDSVCPIRAEDNQQMYSSTGGASKINCFDLTDLKEQLQNIKGHQEGINKNYSHKKSSILKNIKNMKHHKNHKSVRRVLRFDIPDENIVNKENSVLKPNLSNFKVDLLSCNKHKGVYHEKFLNDYQQNNILVEWNEKPIYCSTPNSKGCDLNLKQTLFNQGNIYKQEMKCKSSMFFSSLKNLEEFEFKCGKCQKLFKENLELVCHVKNYHKKLGFKVLKPSYRCAICNAKFFKNFYLKKHHWLHKPY